MARIVGKSDAWQRILADVSADCPNAASPADVHAAIMAAEADASRWNERAADAVQAELQRLQKEISVQKEAAITAYAARKAQLAHQRQQAEDELHRIRHAFLIARWFYKAIGRERLLRESLWNLEASAVHAADDANRRRGQAEHTFADINADPDAAAAHLVKMWAAWLDRLRAVVASKEWSGAAVELEVIDELTRLPDSYVVLSGIGLWLHKAVRYDGEYLKSAQVDHAVVGPTGIFVVETKAWSREFADSGEGYNPYAQVGRARFLCKCVLNDALSTRVSPRPYGLIAFTGSLPPKPTDSVVSAMHPSQLRHFITRNWGNPLDDKQVRLVADELETYLPRTLRM